jgi:hypothetical protein
MKSKLVLLLMAAVGSTALVASAQSPTPAYVIRDQGQDTVAPAPVPPPPPVAPAAPVAVPLLRPYIPDVTYRTLAQTYHITPDEANLSGQAEQLAHQLAAARSDSDREKIKGQLAELLGKQFDQRQKRHGDEIKKLEDQIKKLRDLVDKRQENRSEIISARLNQIVKESQGLGW